MVPLLNELHLTMALLLREFHCPRIIRTVLHLCIVAPFRHSISISISISIYNQHKTSVPPSDH